MDVSTFLEQRHLCITEGHCMQVDKQIEDLIKLTQDAKTVLEIGFNAGHSAELFLKHNPNLHLTSFDLGRHDYVKVAKEYMDLTYPNRHTLILGDSRITVPQFVKDHPDTVFDVLFIDGGHGYEIIRSDMDNCFKMAHKESIVILDDTIFNKEFEYSQSIGPTQVWNEYVAEGKVTELVRKAYRSRRGMVWGKFNV